MSGDLWLFLCLFVCLFDKRKVLSNCLESLYIGNLTIGDLTRTEAFSRAAWMSVYVGLLFLSKSICQRTIFQAYALG